MRLRHTRLRSLSFTIVFALLGLALLPAAVAHAHDEWEFPLPALSARGAILIDADTGQVLYGRAEHERFYPASTTKIMTALLALERDDEEALTTVTRTAVAVEGSLAYLQPGERISLHDLLHGLMLVSGNDAAIAIAEHISGSEAAFADLMNERAAALGLTDTHFVNPHGLHDPEHYTTPADLARLARHALSNDAFARLVATTEYTIEAAPRRDYINTNRLLWTTPGVTGVKTGYTPEANSTYVASAERDGRRLIAVVMDTGTEEKWSDAAALLDYGFAAFVPWPVLESGEPATHVTVAGGAAPRVPAMPAQSVTVLVGRDGAEPGPYVLSPADLEVTPALAAALDAPITAGTSLGTAQVTAAGHELGRTELIAAADVPIAETPANPRWEETKQAIAAWPVWELIRLWWYVPLLAMAAWRLLSSARRRRRTRRQLLQRQSAAGALPMHRLFRGS